MARRTIKVLVEFELDEQTDVFFRSSSIERVINTSMGILEDSQEMNADINYSDWSEWKPVIVAMWQGVWNALFIETFPENRAAAKQRALEEHLSRSYVLRKGNPT